MKDYLKSYSMYIPGSNKLIKFGLYFAYPVVLAAIFAAVHVVSDGFMYYLSLYSIVATEIVFDKYLLSGISRKDGLRTMFLRLSNSGLDYMNKALLVDVIRRGLNIVISNVTGYLIAVKMFPQNEYVSFDVIIAAIVLAFLLEEIGLWIARKYDNIMITTLVAYIACTCLNLLVFFDLEEIFVGENNIAGFSTFKYGLIFVLVVASAIVTPLRIDRTKKAGKEGYYD